MAMTKISKDLCYHEAAHINVVLTGVVIGVVMTPVRFCVSHAKLGRATNLY